MNGLFFDEKGGKFPILFQDDKKKRPKVVVPRMDWMSDQGKKKQRRTRRRQVAADSQKPFLPQLSEKTLQIWKRERARSGSLFRPVISRLSRELQYKDHDGFKVPFWFVTLTSLGKSILQNQQNFNPNYFNAKRAILCLLYHRSNLLRKCQYPRPFSLTAKPTDAVFFVDRLSLCSILTERQEHLYVPVYFRNCYFIYALWVSLTDLVLWNWLQDQWVPECKSHLQLSRIFLCYNYVEERQLALFVPGQFKRTIPDSYLQVPQMMSFLYSSSE